MSEMQNNNKDLKLNLNQNQIDQVIILVIEISQLGEQASLS